MTGNTKNTMALLTTALLVTFLGGCDLRKMSFNSEQRQNGLVVVFPGIDGRQIHNEELCRGFVASGVNADVVLVDWTSPLGAIYNQTAVDHNRKQAADAAKMISNYLQANPNSPVYMVGHSGGTAIAVWATELLPRGQKIEGIVLLASSLSPKYDMSRALANTRKGIVNFHSRKDQALLNTGTTLFGTMDGVNSHSAGFSGFAGTYSNAGSPLVQYRWNKEMKSVGYHGDHFSICSRSFSERLLAPLFELSQWDNPAIASIVTNGNTVLASR